MKPTWSKAFSVWRERGGVREISRRTFLAVYILFVMTTGLFVFLMPTAEAEVHRVVLAACAFLLVLMPLAWVRVRGLFSALMHLVTLQALAMVVYIAAHSGGINSPAMVWLSILSVPVLMLRGPKACMVWVGLIELCNLGMMLATQQGWISSLANISREGVPWALATNLLALADLMFAVIMYHLLHALQMKELNQRTRDLQSTHRSLAQAQAHKDEFVAAVGHELRTPMNAILGFNGVLQAELADRPEQLEVVEHIRRSTEHLLQVVNEILDFSQLQAGKVQLAPHDFDLHAAVRELMAKYEILAREKGLELVLQGLEELPRHVHMDRQRLRQVVGLLLNNAIKFTTVGHVHLVFAQRGARLRCEVRDTGCGIALERQEHIFRRFEHADVQTNRTHGGTGLGLTICQQLIHLHGGEIGLHSVPDQGTTFWFEVSWQPPQALSAQSNQESSASEAVAPRTLLVVDDNPVNLKVAELQIQKIWPQSRVTTVDSAVQALHRLGRGERFDVALIDMVMPEMDGLELTRQIRQRFATQMQAMPIIALTANTQQDEQARCLAAGMSAVLYKPIELQELSQTVLLQLRAHRGGGMSRIDRTPIWSHLRRLLPRNFREGKRSYVFLFTSLIIGLLLVLTPISRYPNAPMLYLPMVGLLVLLIVAIGRGFPITPSVHIATTAGALVMLYVIWFSGGVFSPRLGWLMLLPLTPFYLVGPRSGIGWGIGVLLMQLAMALASWQGWVPPFEEQDQHVLSSWFTFSMVTVVLVIVPLLYERLYQRAMRESRQHQHELELQRQELERTLQMRELFMATVSHELRTPMNAILGFNALLLSRVHNKPEALKVLRHTSQSAEHLMTVINDILDYSQLQAGKLEIYAETVELSAVVQHAFDLFIPRVQETTLQYRLELDPELPRWVQTDRHRLTQVLVNLLGNALKFTHQGEVVMRVQWLNPGVQFEVRDTGIGIAADQQSRIFSRYSQAEQSIQSRYGGNGLGLAISRQLVHLLGGEIGFESQLGQGSRFWFHLPLTACVAPERRPTARPAVHTAEFAWRFLLVDDHAINRLLAQQVLRSAWPKAEIVEAADGQQALDRLAENSFDLVLMDMVMPGMDGIVATQRLRSTLPAPISQVPVLGLTANVNPADLDAFQRAGLSGLMLKPFEPAVLCSRIEQLLLLRNT